MKNPNMLYAEQSYGDAKVSVHGIRTISRPQLKRGIKNRFKLAWMVFTGKADALVWPLGQ